MSDHRRCQKNELTTALLALAVFIGALLPGYTKLQAEPILTKTEFNKIPGWSGSDKTQSFLAFQRSCEQMQLDNRAFHKNPVYGGTYDDWRKVCEVALKDRKLRCPKKIERFFEESFTAFTVSDPILTNGLFTGYFEPVIRGSLSKTKEYQVPIYKRPDDLVGFDKAQEKKTGLRYGRLVDNKPTPYYTRKQIEQGQLAGKDLELLWVRSYADAFFMQVQGSGRVKLDNNQTVRLAYAGKTGRPYTAIGAILVEKGEVEKDELSMQSIRDWINENPEKSRELMWSNKSFVFFRRLPESNPDLGPVGAQHVNLTPQVSLAVDRRYWALGTPVWLDTEITTGSTKQKQWQSLMVAQDTGSAIRGFARGDVFWGTGEAAGEIAGKMKAAGQMTILLPKALARKIEN